MKTTFRPRSSAKGADTKRLFLVVGVLVAAILIFLFARSLIIRAVSPVWSAQNWLSTEMRSLAGLVRSKESLAAENEQLKQRLSVYDELLSSYRALESSRDELLGAFGRPGGAPGIAAGVLVHPPQTAYDLLMIDAGESEGIREGSRVSLPEGGALGLVEDVFARESQVSLYTSGGRSTSAVLERGNVPVVLLGKGGGSFDIEVPREVDIAEGDRIFLPGLRSELVAVVRKIEVEPTDSAKHVTASGVANITSIRFVIVR